MKKTLNKNIVKDIVSKKCIHYIQTEGATDASSAVRHFSIDKDLMDGDEVIVAGEDHQSEMTSGCCFHREVCDLQVTFDELKL